MGEVDSENDLTGDDGSTIVKCGSFVAIVIRVTAIRLKPK
jgi:hypothetical protein